MSGMGKSEHRDGHISIFMSVTTFVQVLQCCGAERKKKWKCVRRDGSDFRLEILDGLEMAIS